MRAAPAVSVHCTGGPAWRGVQSGLPALAAGVLALWAFSLSAGHATLGMLALAAGLACTVAAIGWRARPQTSTHLGWDGQQWTADGTSGSVQVMIDLGPWLLLRLHAERARPRWLAVTAAEAGPAWHALRAALYARRPAGRDMP